MTEAFERDAVRYEGDRPVAVGDLRLAQPTRMATTAEGFWGLYEVSNEVLVVHPGQGGARPRRPGPGPAGRPGRRRRPRRRRPEVSRSFLPLLGGDDPGAAGGVAPPPLRVEQGPPPTCLVRRAQHPPALGARGRDQAGRLLGPGDPPAAGAIPSTTRTRPRCR